MDVLSSGDFMIFENQNLCCIGKIRSPEEDFLCVQDIVHDMNEKRYSESEITLNTSDIYKDLKAVGYDYGNLFKGLRDIKTDDFQEIKGTVEWDGNWVTFMDSLLQTMALAMPFRKLMVPVMIKRLRCDPKVMYEGIDKNRVIVTEDKVFNEDQMIDDVINDEEAKDEDYDKDLEGMLEIDNKQYLEGVIGTRFHMYKSHLPFYANMNSRMIVTHGIEIEDLMALPIPRKTNVQDLKLESYQFLANEDMNAIEESNKTYLLDYLKVCSGIASKAKKILENQNFKKDEEFEKFIDNRLKDIKDNEIMLKILQKINTIVNDNNRNFDENTINRQLTELQTNPDFDMNLDVINQVSKNELLVRSLLDIVSENYVPKREIKVLEINLTNGLMAAEVDHHLASSHIYPIDVNYSLVVKSIESIPEDFKNKTFKLNEWNHKSSAFPTDISPTDLIVMKDSPDLRDVKLEDYIQEAYDLIITNGFLLSIFKYKYTEPELTLNSMNGRKQLNDSDLEQRITEFVAIAKKTGFAVIGRKCDSINSMSILFRKVDNPSTPVLPKKENIIEISSDTSKWFGLVKERLLKFKEMDNKENLWLIAKDSQINGIIGLINCLRLEPGGETIRCLFDCKNLAQNEIKFSEKPFSDVLFNDLVINVLKDGKFGTYRHITLPKDYDKTKSEDYFLNVGQTRDLSNLQWFDARKLVPLKDSYDLCNKYQKKIKCDVYSSGLNFRDVMLATGIPI